MLWRIWAKFLAYYPEVRLELTLEQELADVVRDRYDAGIRFGEAVDLDMIALRVAPDLRMAAGHNLNVRVDGQITGNLAAHALRAALDGVGPCVRRT